MGLRHESEKLPYSSYAPLPSTYHRYFGVDESGSMEYGKDCVVLSFVRDKPGSAVPRPPRKKLRYEDLNGMEPFGNFKFLVLTQEMLDVARYVFPEPRTHNERRFGNLYYQYKLRSYAISHLLFESDFNPWNDVAVVDAYGDESSRHDVIYSLSRTYEKQIPEQSIMFRPDADITVPVVMNADTNAILVRNEINDFGSRRVPITNDDVMRFGIQSFHFNDEFKKWN